MFEKIDNDDGISQKHGLLKGYGYGNVGQMTCARANAILSLLALKPITEFEKAAVNFAIGVMRLSEDDLK